MSGKLRPYQCPNGQEEKFILHIDICRDKQFLAITNLEPDRWYARSADGEIAQWASPIFRLTSVGHEFLASINEPSVWEVINSEFKESSIDTIKTVAKDLAVGFAKEKVEKYLNKT